MCLSGRLWYTSRLSIDRETAYKYTNPASIIGQNRMEQASDKSAALVADRLEASQWEYVALCLAARHMPLDQLRIDNWTEASGSDSKYTLDVSSPFLD